MTTTDVLFIFIAMFRYEQVKTRKGLYEFKYGDISKKKTHTPRIQIVTVYIEKNIPIGSINTFAIQEIKYVWISQYSFLKALCSYRSRLKLSLRICIHAQHLCRHSAFGRLQSAQSTDL